MRLVAVASAQAKVENVEDARITISKAVKAAREISGY